jgi:hypothetical protein
VNWTGNRHREREREAESRWGNLRLVSPKIHLTPALSILMFTKTWENNEKVSKPVRVPSPDRLFCQVAFRAPQIIPSPLKTPFKTKKKRQIDRKCVFFIRIFFYSSRSVFFELTGAYFVAG